MVRLACNKVHICKQISIVNSQHTYTKGIKLIGKKTIVTTNYLSNKQLWNFKMACTRSQRMYKAEYKVEYKKS